MNYGLPTSLVICEKEYKIRSDYRAVLDVCTALTDVELGEQDKYEALLEIFYPDFENMPPEHYGDAIKACYDFISGGEAKSTGKSEPQLVSWEQDFKYIIAPINKAAGVDIRGLDYLHWWTFLAYYMEIGDCLFAQIVNIRNKRARGKPLSKEEREWYRRNRELVDIRAVYAERENEVLATWGGG